MKIIYQNTFDNTLTEKYDPTFPREDQYYGCENFAVVADGITRDPIGITLEEAYKNQALAIKNYPRPSGAELAAKEVISTFKNNFNGNLKETLILANQNIQKLNEKYVPQCDYLENDYYGTVASAAFIKENVLYYSYICDCGIIVYDKDGNIRVQTEDELEKYTRPYLNQIPYPWTNPESRIITRRDYRNNLQKIENGICVSYGALTGEESAIPFIKEGSIEISDEDTIIIYSDGFFHFLHEPEFINLILNFNQEEFLTYIEKKANEDYSRYGKEKTLILAKKN